MLLEIFSILIAILVANILYVMYKTMTRPSNYPPSPVGLPFIGNMHQVIPFHAKIGKTAQVYGDVFSVKVGQRSMVFLCGYSVIKEALIDHGKEFASRVYIPLRRLVRGEKVEGIIAANYGPSWATHRKFFHAAMRNLALNKQGFEKRITDELPYMIEELEQTCRKEDCVDLTDILSYAPLNILSAVVFGNRYSYGDKKFKKLIQYNTDFFRHYFDVMSEKLFIFLSALFPFIFNFWLTKSLKDLRHAISGIRDFAKSEIDHHNKNLDSKSPRDFIDYYLLEIQKSNDQHFSEPQLTETILDFFQAGTETTSCTLTWAFLYMANNLDIQKKVHEEIDRVIGFNREPTYEDRLWMPYCEATILEVQRHASIAPIGLSHAPSQDVTVRGYNIPKGSAVLPFLYGMHHDSKHWKNPNNFDPDNFLDSDGKVGIRDAFMPFGAGPRICLGMNVAKQELFVFFVGILQKFKMSPPPGVTSLPEEIVVGLTLWPKPYKLKCTPRS